MGAKANDACGALDASSDWLCKLNVDGSFMALDGITSAGMILCDHNEVVMLAATRDLVNCEDALEAELAAIHEGITLALSWTELDLVVESNCADALHLISVVGKDRSAHTQSHRD